MAKRRRLVWLGAEALTVAWVLACGRVDDGGQGGSGGTASDGGATGGSATGGSAVGGGPGVGGTSPSSGGTGPGVGGTTPGSGGGPITAWDACGFPEGLFDPPCSEADVVVEGQCIWIDDAPFSYPLTDLDVPTPSGLRLALLPKDESPGSGGAAAAAPLVLTVTLGPDTAGTVTDEGFSVTMTGAVLTTSFQNDEVALEPYLEEVPNPELSNYPYYLGDIGVLDGDTVLDQKRLIVEPFYPCIVK